MKYGVTTVQRWISEGLPEGVKAYVQDRDGLLQELSSLFVSAGSLICDGVFGNRFEVNLGTPVILSRGEALDDVPMTHVQSHLEMARNGCWGLSGAASTDEVYALMRLCPEVTADVALTRCWI